MLPSFWQTKSNASLPFSLKLCKRLSLACNENRPNDNSFSQLIVLIKTYQMIPITLILICSLCQKMEKSWDAFFSNFRGTKKQCEFYYFCMRLWLYGVMTKKIPIARYKGPPWPTSRNLYTKKCFFFLSNSRFKNRAFCVII